MNLPIPLTPGAGDLSQGYVTVASLPVNADPTAVTWLVRVQFANLSPDHDLSVRETPTGGDAEFSDVGGSGASGFLLEVTRTIGPEVGPAVDIAVWDMSGGSADAVWTWSAEPVLSVDEVTAYYPTTPLVRNTAGVDNFDLEFNLNRLTIGADPAVLQLVMNNADTLIDGIAFEEGVIPLGDVIGAGPARHFVAVDDYPLFDNLRLWGSRWARADAANLRGDQRGDNDTDESGRAMPPPIQGESAFDKMKREAERRIRALLKFKAATQAGRGAIGSGDWGIAVLTSTPMYPPGGPAPLPVYRYPATPNNPSNGSDVLR